MAPAVRVGIGEEFGLPSNEETTGKMVAALSEEESKSPQQMMGAMMREMLPEQLGVKNEDLFVCSIMPCTAKKFEIRRPEFEYTEGKRDTDEVITTERTSLVRRIEGFASTVRSIINQMLPRYAGKLSAC